MKDWLHSLLQEEIPDPPPGTLSNRVEQQIMMMDDQSIHQYLAWLDEKGWMVHIEQPQPQIIKLT